MVTSARCQRAGSVAGTPDPPAGGDEPGRGEPPGRARASARRAGAARSRRGRRSSRRSQPEEPADEQRPGGAPLPRCRARRRDRSRGRPCSRPGRASGPARPRAPGSTMRRSAADALPGSPRSRRARRTRWTLSASCGNSDERDDHRGADLVERRRQRRPAAGAGWPGCSRRRRRSGSWPAASRRRARRAAPRDVSGPKQRDARSPVRQGDPGQVEQHVGAVPAAEERRGRRPGSRRRRARVSRYSRNDSAHGASVRRASTVTHATRTSSTSSQGFVVREAAAASPSAQIHQAAGCRSRGSVLMSHPPVARPGPRPPRRAAGPRRSRRGAPPGRCRRHPTAWPPWVGSP